MLGGIASPAPPKDRSLLDDVVDLRLPDPRQVEIRIEPVVRKRTAEGERSGDVVIGDNDRVASLIAYKRRDFGEPRDDLHVRPSFDRPPELDTGGFAKDSRIDPFGIVPVAYVHDLSAILIAGGRRTGACGFRRAPLWTYRITRCQRGILAGEPQRGVPVPQGSTLGPPDHPVNVTS